jgi:tripartite motif-containing protein 71
MSRRISTWRTAAAVGLTALATTAVLVVPAHGEDRGFEVCTVAASCQEGTGGVRGGEFNHPDGVAADAAGNVYVADSDNQRIQKFDSFGNWERTWGKDVVAGGGTGFEVCTVATSCKQGVVGGLGGEFFNPYDVGTDAAGNVYVVDTSNSRIQKFDSSGNWERAWGVDVDSGGGTGFEVCTVAPSCKQGASGELGGELAGPHAVAADAAGNVYVDDTGNLRIQKFDSSGNWERAWGKDVDSGGGTGFEVCTVAANCKRGAIGGLGGELDLSFAGIAADAAGSVYVAGTWRIQKFDSFGNWERTWGKDVDSGGGTGFEVCTVAANCQAGDKGGLGGELYFPFGVAADAAGKVYVVDAGNSRIDKFDSSGNWERAWGKDVDSGGGTAFEVCTVATTCKAGTNGGLGGELSRNPFGVAVDAAGDVFLGDSGGQRVQKFDSSGNWERTWGRDVVAGAARNLTPPACGGARATIVGTKGSDVLRGTPRRDVIVGLGGNDKVSALAGNDLVCGGRGNDTLKGGGRNDRLYGQQDDDKLAGNEGNDALRGGDGKDGLNGGPGKDKQVQ